MYWTLTTSYSFRLRTDRPRDGKRVTVRHGFQAPMPTFPVAVRRHGAVCAELSPARPSVLVASGMQSQAMSLTRVREPHA